MDKMNSITASHLGAARIAAATLIALGTSTSFAADAIKGSVGSRLNGYSADLTNITFVDGGAPAYGGSAVIVCIDPFDSFPSSGSTHTYDVVNAAAVIAAPSSAAGKTKAMIDWVFDHYYVADMNSATATSSSGYGFNEVLWELTTDYDGTLGSINIGSGQISDNNSTYTGIVGSLKASYGSILSSYRSSQFSINFLSDSNSRYQNMVLVTPVPEPSSYLLMAIGFAGLLLWRRQSRST